MRTLAGGVGDVLLTVDSPGAREEDTPALTRSVGATGLPCRPGTVRTGLRKRSDSISVFAERSVSKVDHPLTLGKRRPPG
jgi:hypothetical protein